MRMIKKPAGEIMKHMENALGVLFFTGMFGAVTIQIFSRYVLRRPLVWPFELSVFCFIYIVYLGAGTAARRGSHVAFDAVYERFPRKVRDLIRIFTNLFVIGALLLVFPSSLSYITFIGSVKSSALGIPWGWVFASFPIGTGLIILHLSVQTVRHIGELISERRDRCPQR